MTAARTLPTEALRDRQLALLKARAEIDLHIATVERILADRGISKRRDGTLHGTDSGYFAHRRRWNTPPCDPCKKAHAEAERARKTRRAAT